MIHGLSDEEIFKVIRPILGDHYLDGNMPTIHRTLESQLNIEDMIPIGIQNFFPNHCPLLYTFPLKKKILNENHPNIQNMNI